MADDFEPASLDPRSWYRIAGDSIGDLDAEGMSSGFYFDNDGSLSLERVTAADYKWQFQPVDNTPGRYAIRLSTTGSAKQLSVCHVEVEADNSRTRPCMATASDEQEQQWDVAARLDGSYTFVNVRNGSDYHLDRHLGSHPFMRSVVDNPSEAGEHWVLTPAGSISDRSYLTTFHKPRIVGEGVQVAESAHLARRQESTDASPSGVSVGAAAGIGIAVALTIIIAAALALLFYLRRRGVTISQIRRLERQQDNRHSAFTHRRNRSNGSSLRSDRHQLRPQDSFYSSSNAEFLGTNVISPTATPSSTNKTIYSNPFHTPNKELFPSGVINAPSPSVSPFLPHPAVAPPLPTAGNPLVVAEMPTGLETQGGMPSHPIGITSTTGLTSTTNLALKPIDTKPQTWNSNPWAFLPPAANGTSAPSQQQQQQSNGSNPYQQAVFEAPTYSYRSELDSSPSTPKALRS
jgi:hypothetical protein